MLDKPIKLLFAGDFIPPQDQANSIYSQELLSVLADKDYSIVNLEAPLTNRGAPTSKAGNNFRRNPNSIKHVKAGKFDAVCLANNHIRDYGDQGVLDTLQTCRNNSIETVGAGENLKSAQEALRVTIKGKKLSFINLCEQEFNIAADDKAGANPYTDISAFYQIKEEKKYNDYVFVIYHGGVEYHHYPYPYIVDRFRYMIDVGADGVISHHTHRYSGYEVYKEKPVFYGLGNFLSSTKTKPTDEWCTGAVIGIEILDYIISFKYFYTKMNESFSFVKIIKDSDTTFLNKTLNEINSIIALDKLNEYWANENNNEIRILGIKLFSISKLHYRIIKRFPILNKLLISNYRLKKMINIVRCDAHRFRTQNIIESVIKERK